MDSLTQMLFGGAVGQAMFRHQLGRRATVAGAIFGLLPDLDVATGLFGQANVVDGWLYHRAASHSLPVALAYGAGLGWMLWRAERLRRRPADLAIAASHPGGSPQRAEGGERRRAWMWLGALGCATHPLIDLFTAYGTQLLAPFSTARFAIDAMPIIDPFYSLPLLFAFLFGLIARHRAVRAQQLAALSLVWVVLYTTFAWGIGLQMADRARAELRREDAAINDSIAITAYPTIFQPLWRRIVADRPDEILIGFASPLQREPIRWQRFPRPDATPALQAAQASYEAGVFRWFAAGRVHWRLRPDPAPDNAGGMLVEARDYRYGAPGGHELGYWGLRFTLDAGHRVLGEPVLLSERPALNAASLATIWAGVLGR